MDDFFAAKFVRIEDSLEVRDGWEFAAWVAARVADIPKTCTPVTEQQERVAERCEAPMLRGGVCKRRLGHLGKCQISVYIPRSLEAAR